MRADKLAVTHMKRDQIIESILTYHYLFPHLLTKTGSKRSSRSKAASTNPTKAQSTPIISQSQPLTLVSNPPPMKINPNLRLDPSKVDPCRLQGIPADVLQQLFAN